MLSQSGTIFVGTGGISVHWNQIALAALPATTNLLDTARLFAMLNTALFDGRIVYFTMKYRDLTWRPITAIRSAFSAGGDHYQVLLYG